MDAMELDVREGLNERSEAEGASGGAHATPSRRNLREHLNAEIVEIPALSEPTVETAASPRQQAVASNNTTATPATAASPRQQAVASNNTTATTATPATPATPSFMIGVGENAVSAKSITLGTGLATVTTLQLDLNGLELNDLVDEEQVEGFLSWSRSQAILRGRICGTVDLIEIMQAWKNVPDGEKNLWVTNPTSAAEEEDDDDEEEEEDDDEEEEEEGEEE